jgi:hypothetical protein
MPVRKTQELSVEVLHVKDRDVYFVIVDRYVKYTHNKEMISNILGFIPVEKKYADELIENLQLIPIENENKSRTNYRGKCWQAQLKRRTQNRKSLKK